MRCVTIEELAVVSGSGDPSGCKSDITAGAGIGGAVGTAVGTLTGAIVGTVAGPGGMGMGAVYGGAIGSEIGLLAGGAVAAAYSPACIAPTQTSASEPTSSWEAYMYNNYGNDISYDYLMMDGDLPFGSPFR